ncbi:MAG: hypothetical protein ACI976_000003 [Aureispira sp.]|jgi:hypothetical protein
MQRFSFLFSFLCCCYFTNAQDASTVLYSKDSSSIVKLHNKVKIVYVFSDSKPSTALEELPILLRFGETSITVPTITTIEATSNGRTVHLGEFPATFLDTKLKGHLVFGKMLLNALDTVGSDSTITINTTILLKNKTITGPLYLDFKGGPGIYKKYWNEVEYYKLLEEQAIVQDSIVKLTADNQRAKALMEASHKYLVETAAKVEVHQEELNEKYSQFNANIESLKNIDIRMGQSFEKYKAGEQLTEEEKRKIADLTTDGSKIKREVKQQAKGAKALIVFEKMSKAITKNSAAQKQYDNTKQVFQSRTEQLKLFNLKAEKIKQRLKVLKKSLKF